MAKCKWCGKSFDVDWARDEFETETVTKMYDNLKIRLCADCAVQAINDGVEGVYEEECAFCGKTFDYGEECYKLMTMWNDDGISLDDCWDRFDICCADCAIEKLSEEDSDYEDEYEEDEDDEEIDVYTAAENWLASGRDEDYMFGYTEEELENALNE